MSEKGPTGQALIRALHPRSVAGNDVDIRYLGANLREALAHYRLLYPELIQYRGGLFIEAQFDQGTVDNLMDHGEFQPGDDPAAVAEHYINSVGLMGVTFLAYGIALIAFFAFNVWFMLIDPVFTPLGWLDAVGNAVMLAMCVYGWRKAEPAPAA